MKVLIFDRKMETLVFLSQKFKESGNEVIIAENVSNLLNYGLDKNNNNFDVLIISKMELEHYGINEEYFLKKGFDSLYVCSYQHCNACSITCINIFCSNSNFKNGLRVKLKKILKDCQNDSMLDQNFIYRLPKKSGLLLNHLLLNQDRGLSDDEIAELFWGNNKLCKMNCIYNHIYNLRRVLKSEFPDSFVIHKEEDRYKLIELKKRA